jgi:hypothetical protein
MNFGHFEGRVTATWHDDGRDMTLTAPFAYIDRAGVRWDAPVGSVVNGASIPRAFWSLIGGPFSGEFRNASVVHDVACVDRTRPWKQVHQMFYEACRCGGVGAVKAKTMYYAVFHYGPRWRVEERTTIVAGTAPCSRTTCSTASAVSTLAGYAMPWAMIVDSSATTGWPADNAADTSGERITFIVRLISCSGGLCPPETYSDSGSDDHRSPLHFGQNFPRRTHSTRNVIRL